MAGRQISCTELLQLRSSSAGELLDRVSLLEPTNTTEVCTRGARGTIPNIIFRRVTYAEDTREALHVEPAFEMDTCAAFAESQPQYMPSNGETDEPIQGAT